MIHVHQVLATLGYGDAIGHEVLGIQKVLNGAGYESEIFVETADRRLEHLTTDYRAVCGEVLTRHLAQRDLIKIFPGFRGSGSLGLIA